MRYSQIRSIDISNGEGVGCSLFVQGCHFHCINCFNPNTWDFNGGEEWTDDKKREFLRLINRAYIKRVSILGGEPLAEENVEGVLSLIEEIRASLPDKTIWLYTGYTWEEIVDHIELNEECDEYGGANCIENQNMEVRKEILLNVDVLVDGEYMDSKRDITLRWRGSRNQRVIDVQKSLEKGNVVEWCD